MIVYRCVPSSPPFPECLAVVICRKNTSLTFFIGFTQGCIRVSRNDQERASIMGKKNVADVDINMNQNSNLADRAALTREI